MVEEGQFEGQHQREATAPGCGVLFPTIGTTRPAFLQNAMALEAQGGCTQYLDMPEIEMLVNLCGGKKQVSTRMAY